VRPDPGRGVFFWQHRLQSVLHLVCVLAAVTLVFRPQCPLCCVFVFFFYCQLLAVGCQLSFHLRVLCALRVLRVESLSFLLTVNC